VELIAALQRLLLALVILCTSTAITNAAVGTVTEQSGPTEIKRNKEVIPAELSAKVEMDDTVTTANAKAGITFEDQTQVHITEQSKLVIDNFVYDPNKGAGKLAVKIALGTVKYTSGQIAKNDPQQVKVETPSATIGVRGTDFTSTVDEIGRSTIILLPSCPVGFRDIEKDCITGQIVVMTDAGEVWLTKPFQATAVDTRGKLPTKPVILELSENQINNLLIVTPPRELKKKDEEVTITKNFLDQDFLNVDFLKYDELNKDYLINSRLDINFLDQDFMLNVLDAQSSQFLQSELEEFNSMLPNYNKYNKAAGLKFFVDDVNNLVLYREDPNHYAELNVQDTHTVTYNLTQDQISIKQVVNNAGSTSITIKQSL
jgi:hypothetical protein